MTVTVTLSELDLLRAERDRLRAQIIEAGINLRNVEFALAEAEGELCAGCRGTSIYHRVSCMTSRARRAAR